MNEREIQRIHRSTLVAEHREKMLIEAIGKLRRIIGDTEAAKRELLDCAAVIMCEWERISQ